MLVRSPIMMKLVSGRIVQGLGAAEARVVRHLGADAGLTPSHGLGDRADVGRAVVPQQPPTMFSQPFSANSPGDLAMWSGLPAPGMPPKPSSACRRSGSS